MKLEIVSPEATLFSGEVVSVSVPGIRGEFQMLNNHAPIVSILTKGDVKFTGNNISIAEQFSSKFVNVSKDTYHLAINAGTIELSDNKIIILAN
ncbi:MAG: F0F1 ATP synthase subunit epsilon [Flavobacteriaceae bacterium]|jgi:F-type H+-transporting ATPase subunit epsilon|nr:F0F1 ATP synthase subunit epsilon [Flavobacteriaceae bacterium]